MALSEGPASPQLPCGRAFKVMELDNSGFAAGALHSLQRLSKTCELVVVTSRQHCIQQPTLDWVDKHFPGIFSEVHFGNHWALEGKSKAKSEICR